MRRLLSRQGAADSGQSLVYLALLLVALLGFAGLALDFGSALVVRRQMQNAADAAALAGAREVYLQSGESAVINRIEQYATQYATKNRADSFTWEYYPGGGGVCVTTHANWNTAFIRLFGVETLDVNAISCAASRTDQYAGYAIWAHTDRIVNETKKDCSLEWIDNKEGVTVVGNIRSNYDVTLEGNSGRLVQDGRLEYVNNFTRINCDGSCIDFNPPGENPYKVSATAEWPVSFDIQDFNGVTSRYALQVGEDHYFQPTNGELKVGEDPEGLYFFSQKVKVMNPTNDKGYRRYTVVSTDFIDVKVDNRNMEPYLSLGGDSNPVNGLLYFSNLEDSGKCALAIQFDVRNSEFTGLNYAPNGKIEAANSKNSTFTGMLVANGVQLKKSERMRIIGPGGAFSNVRDVRLVPPP